MTEHKKNKKAGSSTAKTQDSLPPCDSLAGLGRRYACDEPHARQVARLSALVFDKTAALHGLGNEAKVLLHAAAMLHDIGMFVSCIGHHKHSQYLIEQSELPGFAPRERSIVAQIARYHRRGLPDKRHAGFHALSRHDRLLVVKLAALLRIADALDRDHCQTVQNIALDLTKQKCTIAALGRRGRPLCSWDIGDKADLFEKAFKREVVFNSAHRTKCGNHV